MPLRAVEHRQPDDALALIRTPLQLLNAVEACRHFGFARTALMVLEYSGFGLPPFDLSHVDRTEWDSVEVFDLNPIPRPFPYTWLDHPRLAGSEKVNVLRQHHQRRAFARALAPWREVANLLLGNYIQGWIRQATHLCPRARCILLDDGTDTLRIAADRHRRDADPAPPALWRRPKSWWYHRHAAWDIRQRDEVTFFTSYRLDVPPRDEVITNSYRHTRERMGPVRRDRRCLFLGQPLVEDGYLTPAEFRRLLTAVKSSLGGTEMHYVPHRRERLVDLAPALSAQDIPTLQIDQAFEFYLLASASIPAMVASFFSSALDNCRLIWGDFMRIVSFRLPPASLLVAHDYVADVYRYFEHEGRGGIEVVEPGLPLRSARP